MVAFVVKQFENLKSVTKIWVSQMDEIGFSSQRIPTHENLTIDPVVVQVQLGL